MKKETKALKKRLTITPKEQKEIKVIVENLDKKQALTDSSMDFQMEKDRMGLISKKGKHTEQMGYYLVSCRGLLIGPHCCEGY